MGTGHGSLGIPRAQFWDHCIYHAVFETQNQQYPTSQVNVVVLRLICIGNLSGSSLGRDTDYSDFYFSWFSAACLTKCRDTPSLGHAVFRPSTLQISSYKSPCLPRLTPLCTTQQTDKLLVFSLPEQLTCKLLASKHLDMCSLNDVIFAVLLKYMHNSALLCSVVAQAILCLETNQGILLA